MVEREEAEVEILLLLVSSSASEKAQRGEQGSCWSEEERRKGDKGLIARLLLERKDSNIFTKKLNKDKIKDNYIIVNTFAKELLKKYILANNI